MANTEIANNATKTIIRFNTILRNGDSQFIF